MHPTEVTNSIISIPFIQTKCIPGLDPGMVAVNMVIPNMVVVNMVGVKTNGGLLYPELLLLCLAELTIDSEGCHLGYRQGVASCGVPSHQN